MTHQQFCFHSKAHPCHPTTAASAEPPVSRRARPASLLACNSSHFKPANATSCDPHHRRFNHYWVALSLQSRGAYLARRLGGLSMRNLTVNLAIAVTISGFFAVMLSAQAAKGAAQLQSETTYTVAADPYLPIQVIEPAY